ncbi:hypothetical protein RRF57_005551 [Xylaria bambusicola]|uniref:K Homology domain-containing protein n=1 Tax=Xylaria bambusicola TaxID=326684 RepID=A0AAN7UNS7_9PEZI
MSASPTQPTNPAKRPLEDASSPSRSNDQPEAKRPALDKVIHADHEEEKPRIAESNGDSVPDATDANGTSKTTTQDKPVVKDEQGDTIVGDASDSKAGTAAPAVVTGTASVPTATPANAADETAWIHVRAVISSPEAATIIGKGGENVSNIRKLSGAKCTVSDYQKGAVERILTVSGVVDAVAKVGLQISFILFVCRSSYCTSDTT